jgi:hypothetical protein
MRTWPERSRYAAIAAERSREGVGKTNRSGSQDTVPRLSPDPKGAMGLNFADRGCVMLAGNHAIGSLSSIRSPKGFVKAFRAERRDACVSSRALRPWPSRYWD